MQISTSQSIHYSVIVLHRSGVHVIGYIKPVVHLIVCLFRGLCPCIYLLLVDVYSLPRSHFPPCMCDHMHISVPFTLGTHSDSITHEGTPHSCSMARRNDTNRRHHHMIAEPSCMLSV